MKKSSIIILAIVVIVLIIGGIFWAVKSDKGQTGEKISIEDDTNLNFDDEWSIYLEFISAINNRNLDKLNSITYTDYSECFDSYDEEMCWGVIEGMVDAVGQISKTDIVEVWKDSKLAILSTAIEESASGYGRTQLSFVKSGGIKILSVKTWDLISENDSLDSDKDGRLNSDEDCSGNIYTHFPEKCIETDLNKQDTDGDGWWDGIEVDAETNPNSSSSHP